MKGLVGFASFFLPFLIIFSASASADIIKFMDEEGTVHFTDRPVSRPYAVFIRTSRPKPEAKQLFGPHYRKDIAGAARDNGIEPKLIQSVIKVESDYNSMAVSRAGAKGLMQLMPRTARRYKVRNIFSPTENINAGTEYLRDLIERYGGDLKLALAAYNAGEEAVARYSGVPPFPETRKFVNRVLRLYNGKTPVKKMNRGKKRIYRYVDADGNIIITDTPRTVSGSF